MDIQNKKPIALLPLFFIQKPNDIEAEKNISRLPFSVVSGELLLGVYFATNQ